MFAGKDYSNQGRSRPGGDSLPPGKGRKIDTLSSDLTPCGHTPKSLSFKYEHSDNWHTTYGSIYQDKDFYFKPRSNRHKQEVEYDDPEWCWMKACSEHEPGGAYWCSPPAVLDAVEASAAAADTSPVPWHPDVEDDPQREWDVMKHVAADGLASPDRVITQHDSNEPHLNKDTTVMAPDDRPSSTRAKANTEPKPRPKKKGPCHKHLHTKKAFSLEDDTGTTILECINGTCMRTHKPNFAGRDAHIITTQEHSMTPNVAKGIKRYFMDQNWQFEHGPTDPEARTTTAGVATLARDPTMVVPSTHQTKRGQDAYDLGRMQIVLVDIGSKQQLLIINIYGWQGAASDTATAARTNDLMEAALEEARLLNRTSKGSIPILMLGDFNGNPHNFPALTAIIRDHYWTDLGAVAERWGMLKNQGTCIAPSATQATRRDYIIANPEALKLIVDFNIDHCDVLPVHQVIQIKLKPAPKEEISRINPSFTSLAAKVHQFIEDDRIRLHLTDHSKEAKLRSNNLKDSLGACVDHHLTLAASDLEDALRVHSADHHWSLWSSAVEKGFMDFRVMPPEHRRKQKGRGKPRIMEVKVDHDTDLHTKIIDKNLDDLEKEANRCQKQSRRLHHIADRSTLLNNPQCSPDIADQYFRLNDAAFQLHHEHTDFNDQYEADLDLRSSSIKEERTPGHYWVFKNAAATIAAKHATISQAAIARSKDLAAERFSNPLSGPKAITCALKGSGPQPLICVQRKRAGPKGEPQGTFTTDPAEIDRERRHQLGEIYGGNFKNEDQSVKSFLSNYAKDLFIFDDISIPDITGQRLKQICIHGIDSVGGMDHWQPSDFALLSDRAYDQLANLFTTIEAGAPWPSMLHHAKAAFLSKDATRTTDPLEYRVLMILPTVYRKSAKLRLSDLQPWVSQWECPEMFAGIPARGAEHAWMDTAIYAEEAMLQGIPMSAASIDILKCFDQI